jgi:Ca2+-binding RTX toxin-like protein
MRYVLIVRSASVVALRRCSHTVLAAVVAGLLVTAGSAPVSAGENDRCGGQAATIVGTPGPDTLAGTDGDDVIVGLGGDDLVRGGNGSDLICGGAGNDRLYSDRSGRAPGREVLNGGPGIDVLVAGYVSPPNCCSHGVEPELIGGPGDDVLRSAKCDCPSWLYPGPGNDRIVVEPEARRNAILSYRSSPNAVLVDLASGYAVARGNGRDTLVGVHTVWGSEYEGDTFLGSAGSDLFLGLGGADTIRGRGGEDWLYGSDGRDQIYGGRGNDNLDGGRGNDWLDGGRDNDWLNGGPGHDRCVNGPRSRSCESHVSAPRSPGAPRVAGPERHRFLEPDLYLVGDSDPRGRDHPRGLRLDAAEPRSA